MSEPPPSFSEEESFLSLYAMLQKRKKLLLFFPVAVTLLSIIVSFRLPKTYQAKTTLYVVSETSKANLIGILQSQGLPTGLLGSAEGPSQSNYLITLLQSERAASLVIKKLHLAENRDFTGAQPQDPPLPFQKLLKTFRDMTEISKDPRYGSIQVTVESSNPKLAARIANTLTEVVQQLILNKKDLELKFLKDQVDQQKKNVRKLENQLQNFQEKYRKLSASTDIEEEIKLIAKLQADAIAAEVKLAEIEGGLKTAGSLEELAQLRVKKETTEKSLQAVRRQITEEEQKLGAMPSQNIEFARLTRALQIAATLYESILQQYQLTKFERESGALVLQVIDRATPPYKAYKPKKRLIVLAAFLGSFFLSFMITLLLEFLEEQKKIAKRHSKPS